MRSFYFCFNAILQHFKIYFMKKIMLFFVVALGLSLCISSCKTKNTAEECSACKPLPPDKIVTTQIANTDKTFSIWTGGNGELANNAYSIANDNQTSNRKEMSSILEFYHIDVKTILKENDLVSIVLYSTGEMTSKTLDKNNILGAIVYSSCPDQMFIHVFKSDGSEIKLVDGLSSLTGAVVYNDIYSAASIFGNQLNVVAWKMTAFKYAVIMKNAKINFEHKLSKYLKVSYLNEGINNRVTLGFEQSLHRGGCGRPCPSGKGFCSDWSGSAMCDPGDRPMCAMNPMQANNNYDWDNDPRHPFLYDFRDNVLGTSSIGEHIKDDFYYCGSIISGKISSTQAMNGFSLIDNHILPIVKRLNSATASSDSSVIFDKSIRDDINAFVADIKTLSTDPTFEEILDEVVTNVNYTEGKTVAQIKYELTH